LIEELVAPVDHARLDPDVVKVEVPQPFVTVMTGVKGTAFTLIILLEVIVFDPEPLVTVNDTL
jgi:hypothetical protein